MSTHDYLRDPAEITRQSFATIRREADFSGLPAALAPLALRPVHASAMPDIIDDLTASPGAVEADGAVPTAGRIGGGMAQAGADPGRPRRLYRRGGIQRGADRRRPRRSFRRSARSARRLAALTGGIAAITNAVDLRFGFALDDPPAGWRIADTALVKLVTAALLSGDGARLDGAAPWLEGAPWRDRATYRVRVTARSDGADDRTLVIHPAVLAIGVGCERGTEPAELRDLVATTLADAGLAPGAVAAMVSLDLKMDEPAVHAAKITRTALIFVGPVLDAEGYADSRLYAHDHHHVLRPKK